LVFPRGPQHGLLLPRGRGAPEVGKAVQVFAVQAFHDPIKPVICPLVPRTHVACARCFRDDPENSGLQARRHSFVHSLERYLRVARSPILASTLARTSWACLSRVSK
jgi:hypothetical protein